MGTAARALLRQTAATRAVAERDLRRQRVDIEVSAVDMVVHLMMGG